MKNKKVLVLSVIISMLLVAILLSACESTGQGSGTPRGSLYVTSTPSAAKIYVDNVYKGTTPRTVSNLIVGNHNVRVTKVGYSDYSTVVNIQSGPRFNLAVTLTPLGAPAPAPTNTTTPSTNQTNATTVPAPTQTNTTNQTAPTCTNECSSGQTSCSGAYARTCGNYDADACLEWNTGTYCSYGCANGICQAAPVVSNQTNTTQPVNQTNATA